MTLMTLEAFRRMFPRLSADEARRLYQEINAPAVAAVLGELRSRCNCIGGALYCVCGKSERPSADELAVLAPLVEAYQGRDSLPAGGS